ncbi:hypothetical protein TL16_g02807 [Triparma laevis f. inornata]|uniref:SET domain-containing protein n=1 Tax=Triparma laevis f. inornata TaxID=1714386 RepID=A0A9W6ZZI7_9STRA|nr:hypothetical protein TL16_g02807 [Triparma laevis f. inornata]
MLRLPQFLALLLLIPSSSFFFPRSAFPHLPPILSSTSSPINEMEAWLASNDVATAAAKHTETATFRGLILLSTPTATQSPLITLPKKLALSTTSTQNWDVDLATQLLTEICLGSTSSLSGYVSLLSSGAYGSSSTPLSSTLDSFKIPESCNSEPLPNWTAPNSLRHWTPEERSYLVEACGSRGQRALDASVKQLRSWIELTGSPSSNISSTFDIKDNRVLWFVWAMEAVHSRAFMGIAGVENSGAVTAALVAQGLGLVSGCAGVGFDEFPLVVVGGVAFAVGLGFNVFKGLVNPKEVLMLPYIDSANHDESSQNAIEYNPLKQEFELVCKGDQTPDSELFISYGERSPVDLLINFGIVKGGKAGRETDRRIMVDMLQK